MLLDQGRLAGLGDGQVHPAEQAGQLQPERRRLRRSSTPSPTGARPWSRAIDPFATFIHGSKRAAQFSGNVHAATVHIYKGKEIDKSQIDWAAPREPRSPWQAEWKDFLEAIREDRPYNEAERAAYANLAAIMGRAAAHMGRTITWKEMLASNFCILADRRPVEIRRPRPGEPDAQGNYPVPIPGKWVEV